DLVLEIDNGSKFIDFENNNSFCRFVDQKIEIKEVEYNEFDQIFNIIESKAFLSSLVNFEILQKAYYQTLRPLLYSLKNSIVRPDPDKTIKLLDIFIDILNTSSSGLSEE